MMVMWGCDSYHCDQWGESFQDHINLDHVSLWLVWRELSNVIYFHVCLIWPKFHDPWSPCFVDTDYWSTQSLTNDISIESSLCAVHNDIRFSFVQPTSATYKLKAPRKLLRAFKSYLFPCLFDFTKIVKIGWSMKSVSLTWNIALTQNLANDLSIESSLDAEHNDIRFSFVQPTSAA